MILRLSKKPTLVIIRLLLRYIMRLDSTIIKIWARNHPISCYYFVQYHQILPFILISTLRAYNFTIINQTILLDLLKELKILDSFSYGYAIMQDAHGFIRDDYVYMDGNFATFINYFIQNFGGNNGMPKIPEPNKYTWMVGYDPSKDYDDTSEKYLPYNKVVRYIADVVNNPEWRVSLLDIRTNGQNVESKGLTIVDYIPKQDIVVGNTVTRNFVTIDPVTDKSFIQVDFAQKKSVEEKHVKTCVVVGPATDDELSVSKKDKGKGRMPTEKEYEKEQRSIKEKLSISNLITGSKEPVVKDVVEKSETALPAKKSLKSTYFSEKYIPYSESSQNAQKRAGISQENIDAAYLVEMDDYIPWDNESENWDDIFVSSGNSSDSDKEQDQGNDKSSTTSQEKALGEKPVLSLWDRIKAAKQRWETKEISHNSLPVSSMADNTKSITNKPLPSSNSIESPIVLSDSSSSSSPPSPEKNSLEITSRSLVNKANNAISSKTNNPVSKGAGSPIPYIVRSPVTEAMEYIDDSGEKSLDNNLSMDKVDSVKRDLKTNMSKEYIWEQGTLNRIKGMNKFHNQEKLPKLDIFTFDSDYLEAKRELISPFPMVVRTAPDGSVPIIILGDRYKQERAFNQFIEEYKPEQPGFSKPEYLSSTNAIVDYYSYFKNVDHADKSAFNTYNLRDKGHVRDINRVFNDYYHPGYVPKDVYWNLWLEDAYNFLLKSKFSVNRLLDGKYEYILDKLSLTPEEKKVMEKELKNLKEENPDCDVFNYLEAYGDQETKICMQGHRIKKGIIKNREWLFNIYYYGGDVDVNGSSPIFNQWTHYNLREALKDCICVLDKHNIVNNPVWKYGLQDRRWFGEDLHTFKRLDNPLIKDDKEYRDLYNLPSVSHLEKLNLKYHYDIDKSAKSNKQMYTELLSSSLSNFERDRLDKKALMIKPIVDYVFENNRLHRENFKGKSNLITYSWNQDITYNDVKSSDMPFTDIEYPLRDRNLKLFTSKSLFTKLTPKNYDAISYEIKGSEYRNNKLLPKIDYHNPKNIITSRVIPELKSEPWVFKIPENADGFTDDCYIWENDNCKGLVPKERMYVHNIPKPDLTRFVNVNLYNSNNPGYPSGYYILSKHTLKDIFSEYEQVMKLTKETCKIIDKNNILLYYNMFENNQKNLCLSCADKVIIYNRELCKSIQEIANVHYNEYTSSRMKNTMANHYLLYTKRAWDLETSYDKLMSRLFRGLEPEKAWTIVELKKEELKNTTYGERKYFRYLVLRDAEYANKYDEKFDIRGTLYSEVKSRKWDKGELITQIVKKEREERWRLEGKLPKEPMRYNPTQRHFEVKYRTSRGFPKN